MAEGVKYLVRTDLGKVWEIPAAWVEILCPQIGIAGLPFEVRDTQPSGEGGGGEGGGGGGETGRRRR